MNAPQIATPKLPGLPGMPSLPKAPVPQAAGVPALPKAPVPQGPPGPPLQGTPEWVEMHQKAYEVAGSKGSGPEHASARVTVIKGFLKFHDPDKFAKSKAFIDTVDLGQPVRVVNGKDTDIQNPKGTGFFGRGRKPAYLASATQPPKAPEDPLYALEYFPK